MNSLVHLMVQPGAKQPVYRWRTEYPVSSLNLDRFIVRPVVGPDSVPRWRKSPVAGQSTAKAGVEEATWSADAHRLPALLRTQPWLRE